jgi:hypothetical protein
MKTCAICGQEKLKKLFTASRKTADKLMPWCNDCQLGSQIRLSHQLCSKGLN